MNCVEGVYNMPRKQGSLEVIKERKCKKCGKNFVVAVEHIYKEHGKYYCSWTCYNHRHDEEEKGVISDERLDRQ